MSADPSEAVRTAGPPVADWLTAVNRQSLTVRLLATTVHDVNNILQVVSGAAEVLALDPSPDAVARRTTSIVAQSAAATTVLQGLVVFARGGTSSADGARPLELAQQALTLRQHSFRKLRIEATADGDPVECAMSRQQLQQVLLNLVVNSEQALTGRGGGAISVAVRGGDVVSIAVTDDGPGFPMARQAAVFAWPPSPGTAAGSLGLGLQVSRALVVAAGGTLTIDAPPEGGTRVVVTLPRLRG